MTLSEALLFLEGVNNRKREQLYNTRWIMWSTLQSQSSKKIKVEETIEQVTKPKQEENDKPITLDGRSEKDMEGGKNLD